MDEFACRGHAFLRVITIRKKRKEGRYLRVPDVNCLHGAERWGQLFRLATWQTLHWCVAKCFRMTGPRNQLRIWWKLNTSRWRESRTSLISDRRDEPRGCGSTVHWSTNSLRYQSSHSAPIATGSYYDITPDRNKLQFLRTTEHAVITWWEIVTREIA